MGRRRIVRRTKRRPINGTSGSPRIGNRNGGAMATIVLVHGGWTGGWNWRDVERRLRSAGHEVYTPTLTGLGERVHLATPEVGLDTHVTDIVNVLAYEDLHDVVL